MASFTSSAMMQELLNVEDLVMQSHQTRIKSIEAFVGSYFGSNSYAIAQICDLIIVNNNRTTTDDTRGQYSTELIQHLSQSSQTFSHLPPVIERIFSAFGSILEHQQLSSFSSIFTILQTMLAAAQQTDNSSVVHLVGEALDSIVTAAVEYAPSSSTSSSGTSSTTPLYNCTRTMRCLVRTLDRTMSSEQGGVANNATAGDLIPYAFTAAGNLIASLASVEIEKSLVAVAVEHGVVEILHRLCKEHPKDVILHMSIWHFMEQCMHHVDNAMDMTLIALACTTYTTFSSLSLTSLSSAKILCSIHLTLSNLIVKYNHPITHALQSNGMLMHIVSTPALYPNNRDISWTALHLFQNVMISSNEGTQPLTNWLCLECHGWNMMLHAMEKFRGDPRVHISVCNALRTALITGGLTFPSLLNVNQLSRTRIELVSLLVHELTEEEVVENAEDDEGSKMEHGAPDTTTPSSGASGFTPSREQEKEMEELVETILLCLVRLKLYLPIEDVQLCVTQLSNCSKFIVLTAMNVPIKLLWHEMNKEEDTRGRNEENGGDGGEVVSSCALS